MDGLAALEQIDPATTLDPEEVQRLLAVGVKLYVAMLEQGHRIQPLPPDTNINATQVVATVSALLDQVDIEVFELGMWQSWGRV
ncbi:MAG: hypothetical protein GEU71_03440 [Actinobacteria bacterium]|nr:hypothetical protein [Actinomycetota bacterium]